MEKIKLFMFKKADGNFTAVRADSVISIFKVDLESGSGAQTFVENMEPNGDDDPTLTETTEDVAKLVERFNSLF